MATVADCHAAVQAAIAGFPVLGIPPLPAGSGYAFQAYVFARVGRELTGSNWVWVHPPANHGPVFAATNGGTLNEVLQKYSYLENGAHNRVFVQELTLRGLSGASHDVDACLVRRPPPLLWDGAPALNAIGTVLECKNYGRAVSMGVARELVGLAADIGALQLPTQQRVILVAAHAVSAGASQFIDAWKILAVEGAHPPNLNATAAWIQRRVRF